MHYIYNVLKENYMLVNFIFSLRSFVALEKSALKKSDVLVWCSAQHYHDVHVRMYAYVCNVTLNTVPTDPTFFAATALVRF